MKNAEGDPARYLPLKSAEFQILLALAAGEQHGYAIMQQINERGGQARIGPATLYRSIKRLLDEGLIEETQERPDPKIDDERRRYYQITDLGFAVATAHTKQLEEELEQAWTVLPARQPRLALARFFHRGEALPHDKGSHDS